MTVDALTDLYRRYGPVIYARCRRLLADDVEAEDATQETFIRVARHIEQVRDPREALTWIYRIATNYCLNELRNRRGRPQPWATLPEPALPPGEPDPETRMADRDLARRLIARCAPKLRAVAWLYHVDGLEQDEVGRVLGVSRRTVVTRLRDFAINARKFTRRSAA